MKNHLIALSICACVSSVLFGQEQAESTDNLLDKVASVYMKNIKPYFKEFAKQQTPDELDSCNRPQYINAIVKLYETKEEFVVKELRTFLINKKIESKNYVRHFSSTYQFEFPGLNYAYFKKCEDEANAILKITH